MCGINKENIAISAIKLIHAFLKLIKTTKSRRIYLEEAKWYTITKERKRLKMLTTAGRWRRLKRAIEF